MLNLKNYVKQELIDVCLLLWKKFDKQNTGYIDEKDLVTGTADELEAGVSNNEI